MSTATTGHVDRSIWWKGIDTIALAVLAISFSQEWRRVVAYNDTLEMAMLTV